MGGWGGIVLKVMCILACEVVLWTKAHYVTLDGKVHSGEERRSSGPVKGLVVVFGDGFCRTM